MSIIQVIYFLSIDFNYLFGYVILGTLKPDYLLPNRVLSQYRLSEEEWEYRIMVLWQGNFNNTYNIGFNNELSDV